MVVFDDEEEVPREVEEGYEEEADESEVAAVSVFEHVEEVEEEEEGVEGDEEGVDDDAGWPRHCGRFLLVRVIELMREVKRGGMGDEGR